MIAVSGPPPTQFKGGKTELNLRLMEGMVRRGQTPPRERLDDEIRVVEGWIAASLEPENRWSSFWDKVCDLGMQGDLAELASLRGMVEQNWELVREELAQFRQIATHIQTVFRKPVRGVELLEPVIQEHDRFQRDVLQRWQTREDLEAILVERFPLSHDRLVEWAKKNPPPQAWYDQDDDPFAPAE